MSAWLIFTALGFYPVAPASNQYVIGRPFVDRASILLPNGRRFTVVADGLSDAHPYVGHVTLDGQVLDRVYLTHEEILRGGELRFTPCRRSRTPPGAPRPARGPTRCRPTLRPAPSPPQATHAP